MHKEKLKVNVFKGEINLVKKSGVGKAIFHQIDILKGQNIEVNTTSLFNADIVHINTVLPLSVFVAILARLAGIKVIYYGHSTMEDFKNSFKLSNFLAPLFKRWIIFCYNLGDVVITPTEYSKKILEGYGIKPSVLALSNGIDTAFWADRSSSTKESRDLFLKKYKLPQDKKIVMSVGHFIERKGILDFIKTARNNPQYTFIWFGYTNSTFIPEEIKYAIDSAPDNLFFPGYINSQELRTAYQQSDVFLFMSHEETEGIVILEAMAAGIPVIVRDIPVYQGWLYNDINVFKFTVEKELPAMLKYVMNKDVSPVVQRAYRTAENRDYNHIGECLLKIYDNLLTTAQADRRSL